MSKKNIKILKFRTGEDILAEVREGVPSLTTYKLYDPFMIYLPRPDAVGLLPYLAFANLDDGLEIAAKDIMWIVEPDESMIKKFEELTSKIKIASPAATQAISGLKLIQE